MAKFILLLIFLLLTRLILFQLFPPPVKISRDLQPESSILVQLKEHVSGVYHKYLPARQAELLMGIVFGAKELDYESVKDFQETGVMHIIAASGMNVTMLTSFVLATLVLFINRRKALVLTAAIVIFYTALADFQPSIVRAAIMGIFALGAGLLGRQNTSFLALFFACWLMIMWDPAIITSIGFMLSVAATLGILLFDPIMKRTILKKEWAEDFRTTTSAQITTTPILLYFFGTYSFVSIVVNLLVLWTIPPLMILGGIGAILSLIPLLAAPFIYLTGPLLTYFFLVIDFFSRISNPVDLGTIPLILVLGYYLILAGLIISLTKRKR